MTVSLHGTLIYTDDNLCRMVRARRHRRPRIDKKWRRFGMRADPHCPGKQMRLLGRLYLCPHAVETLRRSIK